MDLKNELNQIKLLILLGICLSMSNNHVLLLISSVLYTYKSYLSSKIPINTPIQDIEDKLAKLDDKVSALSIGINLR